MKYLEQYGNMLNEAWYENNTLVNLLTSVTGSTVAAGMLLYPDRVDLNFFIISAFMYIVGSVMDRATSIQCSDLQQTYPFLELEETNPLLPTYPSRDDYFRGPKNTIDILGIMISSVFPPFGISIGLGRGLTALNNARVRDRATLVLPQNSN